MLCQLRRATPGFSRRASSRRASINRSRSATSPPLAALAYRDDLFGPDFDDNVFVSEPVHNVGASRGPHARGATFTSRRADDEQDSEFLASTDNWFRPTMVQDRPRRRALGGRHVPLRDRAPGVDRSRDAAASTSAPATTRDASTASFLTTSPCARFPISRSSTPAAWSRPWIPPAVGRGIPHSAFSTSASISQGCLHLETRDRREERKGPPPGTRRAGCAERHSTGNGNRRTPGLGSGCTCERLTRERATRRQIGGAAECRTRTRR